MRRRRISVRYVHDLLLGGACQCNHREVDENGNVTACTQPASYDAIYVVKPVPADGLWHTPLGYCQAHGGRAQAEKEAVRLAEELTAQAAPAAAHG